MDDIDIKEDLRDKVAKVLENIPGFYFNGGQGVGMEVEEDGCFEIIFDYQHKETRNGYSVTVRVG